MTHAARPPTSPAKHPRTVEEITRRNVELIHRLDAAAVEQGSTADRVAGLIARACGRIAFVWLHVAWFGGWVGYNALAGAHAFDPYPFTFLTLVVSLEAIFLSTFLLMSQNHEMRISERRAQLDLQVNLLTEQENTKILQLLERVARHVGVDEDDPALRALEEVTHPEKLVAQIEQVWREQREAGVPVDKKAAQDLSRKNPDTAQPLRKAA